MGQLILILGNRWSDAHRDRFIFGGGRGGGVLVSIKWRLGGPQSSSERLRKKKKSLLTSAGCEHNCQNPLKWVTEVVVMKECTVLCSRHVVSGLVMIRCTTALLVVGCVHVCCKILNV